MNYSFHAECKSVDRQHPRAKAVESTRNTLQRDTFEVGVALLTAVSLSRRQCVLDGTRLVCHAHRTLRMWRVHGLDSEFAKLFLKN